MLRVNIQGGKSLWGITLFLQDWAPGTQIGGEKSSRNAGRALVLSIDNIFYIYRIVNKNFFGCWTGEGNVKNSN